VPLPVTPPENEIVEESPASDVSTAGVVAGAAAGPAIIDLSQRKPRTTAQLPPDRQSSSLSRHALNGVTVLSLVRLRLAWPQGYGGGCVWSLSVSFGSRCHTHPANHSPTFAWCSGGGGPRRPRRSRLLLGILLLLLTALLVCGSLIYAQPRLFGISATNLPGLPGSTPAATVTIMPSSQIVSNSYVITGVAGTPIPNNRRSKLKP